MFDGISVYEDRRLYPIAHAIRYDFQNNSDSIKAFFESNEKDFENYLRSYTGEIDPWLDKESRRRRVR
jgi:hypothetical protein